ncbi:putative oxygenase MesX, partial [Acinetobacter baumannii]
MSQAFTFTLKRSCFDENYNPSENTRTTTNFANLARGEKRQENLRNTLVMINNRFNALASWDNPKADRYAVELEIISVDMNIGGDFTFPAIEILQTTIVDKKTHERIEGIVGNNFSSYVRDYDFSVLLLEHNKDRARFSLPENFGELHGNIFKSFVHSAEYQANFKKAPV